MKIDNSSLKQFAGSMAKCLAAALPVSQALELSGARTPSRPLRKAVDLARQRCEDGLPVSEALAPVAALFPRHFLPVLRAGEAAGKQAEAFHLLYQHCQQTGPSLRVVRNTWLYPLICIVFGWIIRVCIFIYFGKYHAAVSFAVTAFGLSALLGLTGWLLFRLPPVKRAVDFLLLQLPVLRETELRLGFVLFFSTFRLTYEAGGLSVVRMFDLALATVRNDTIRRDLLPAREILAENGPIGDAFEESNLLDVEMKGLIHTGSLSGQLDQCLNKIVEKATWQLELTLRMFNQIFQRLVVFCVVMSIIETVLMCILVSRPAQADGRFVRTLKRAYWPSALATAAGRASPRTFLSMMLPCGSIRMVDGMPSTPYWTTSLFCHFKPSKYWGQVMLFSWVNFTIASLSSSRLTPMISKPWAWYLA